MTKFEKIESLEVENIDWGITKGIYKKDYHGKIVYSDAQVCYCDRDGKGMNSISIELAALLEDKGVTILEVVEVPGDDPCFDVKQVAPTNSLIDSIGVKPKSINIEF